MKQVLIRKGRVTVEEMPEPLGGDGLVVVRAAFSVISPGTETTTVASSAAAPPSSVWRRRLQRAGDVARLVARRGVREAATIVRGRLAGPATATGYSLAGTVLRVGPGVDDLVPGQRVACAGAGLAHHAEIVAVPRQLVVPVPHGLPLEHAAFVTLGAIALHGVHQADARLGEVACVIGLGLVGQLTAALLHAAGCRVVAADLRGERVERARGAGVELAVDASREDLELAVERLTAGRGADVVLVTAAASSSDPLRQAVRLVRERGRVVVVGAVGMDLDRAALYAKEAELRIARSYGPGRHDPRYELLGVDYPYPFVRWTENRNMAEFLRLAAAGSVALDALVDRRVPVDEAPRAYAQLSAPAPPIGVLLCYPGGDRAAAPAASPRAAAPRSRAARRPGELGAALVGPGSFARRVHLPNLAALAPSVRLRAVVSRSAHSAKEASRRFGAELATTDLDAVLADDGVDLVLIATRHDLHAEQAARCLEAGKAVFLEKPAALDAAGLARLEAALSASGRPFTLGLNRRFAPDLLALGALVAARSGPVVIDYRVNAGRLGPEHWLHGPQGGGRLIGEACHMIDLLDHLVGRPRERHCLTPLAAGRSDLPATDNFVLTCRYADGSLATLSYSAVGHAAAGKERLECHWDGRSASIEEFRGLRVLGVAGCDRDAAEPDKGHAALLGAFVAHVAGGGAEPIPLGEILRVSRFALELDGELRGRDRGSILPAGGSTR